MAKQRTMYQYDLFDFDDNKLVIPQNKGVRLIEFFAGVGFTHMGIKKVFPNVESWKICEWAIPSIIAYDSVHNGEMQECLITDKEFLVNELYSMGVSLNYNDPAKKEQIQRLPLDKLQQVYSAIQRTNNLVNIMNVKGSDLEVVDTDKYTYIMTYSFPCQDLSVCGDMKGFDVSQAQNENQSIDGGLGTRSGLVWEIIRILKEMRERESSLPQILIMENVIGIHSQDNLENFIKLQNELSSLGYKSEWKDLVATDYGIAQNRIRTFMVSYLDTEKSYTFPAPTKTDSKLKDFLEDNVDERYYLSQKMINGMLHTNFDRYKLENKLKDTNGVADCILARFDGAPQCVAPTLNIKTNNSKGYIEATDGDGVDISGRAVYHRGTVFLHCSPTLTTMGGNDVGVVLNETEIPLKRGYSVKVKDETDDPKCVDIIGNYSKSNYNQTLIVGKNGIAPTVTENHGQVTAIVDSAFTETEKQLFTEDGNIKRYANSDKVDEFKEGECAYTDYANGYGHGARTSAKCETVCAKGNAPIAVKQNLRIRKLTPKECMRLMGADDIAYERMVKFGNLTDSKIYHIAGDGLVVQIIENIVKQMKED